ncbi:MAG: A24 family peptidase [Planctomycetaceae bacterium]|jgi:prepilin signal peptidase PulO-like enzyme (type II secretory pathway)|nr:A24 family peptidase [Planctomycetaceae bacterium]
MFTFFAVDSNFTLSLILQYSIIVYLILFLIGAIIGAVINWYVDRYSWVKRFRSAWRRTDKLQRVWFDFIPILGWLNLRRFGKNLNKLPESARVVGIESNLFWVRPFFVELFTAFGLVLLYYWEVELNGLLTESNFTESIETKFLRFTVHVFLFALLFAASLTDLDDFIIPENLTIFGTISGLIIVTIFPQAFLPATELYFDQINKGQFIIDAEKLTPYPVPLHFCSPDKVDVLRNYGIKTPQERVAKSLETNFRNENSRTGFVLQFWVITLIWLFWCFAMMDRVWYFRLSFRRAFLLFLRYLYRSPATKFWLVLSIFAPILFVILLFFTDFFGSLNCHYLTSGLIGLAAGIWLIWSVRLIAGLALGVEAMGFGDVMLLGMVGVFVGWQSCVVIFFLAPFAGIVPSLIGMLLGRGRMIPYGPFLSLATLLLIIFWSPIWRSIEPILFQSSIQVAIAVQILIVLLGVILVCWRKIKEKFLK